MVRAVDAVDRFRVPILHALYDLSDGRSANQLCELARRYAEAEDETFRKLLYEIVEQKPIADSRCLAEEEIIHLDGDNAFLFAARVRGKQMATREWEWDDGNLVDCTTQRCGKERVDNLLEHTTDEAIRLFRDGWHEWKKAEAEQKQLPSRRDSMREITVADIIMAAESDDARFNLFRGWGMHADATDLGMVLQHLRDSRNPNVITKLLKVFSNRPHLNFDTRLIDLCQHGDSEVRRWAFNALQNERTCLDSCIRAFSS